MPSRADRPTIDALFDGGSIHHDVYRDPDLFAVERRRLFGAAWLYAAHGSQFKRAGDYVATEIAGEPVILLRGADGAIRGFFNRCPHRGALLTRAACGHASPLQCSYHGWTFDTQGGLDAIPMESGYAGTGVARDRASFGLRPVPRIGEYRGFWFVSLAENGPALRDFLGPTTDSLDNMIERAPDGELEISGVVLRMTQRSNWKIYLENIHDGAHAMPTHQSSIDPARRLAAEATSAWARTQAEIVMANSQSPRAMAALSVQCYRHGHSLMRGFRKTRPDTAEQKEYEALLQARLGPERAEQVLTTDLHNVLIYPGLSLQPNHMQLRVIVPLAVDRTRIDVSIFRLKGAPDAVNRRFVTYANVIHSPASLVRADDLENFERIQDGYRAHSAPWVSAHRELASEPDPQGASTAMSERYVRNQFDAWKRYMAVAA
jgi:2-chlorobenzoate 1,2-dioxygenase